MHVRKSLFLCCSENDPVEEHIFRRGGCSLLLAACAAGYVHVDPLSTSAGSMADAPAPMPAPEAAAAAEEAEEAASPSGKGMSRVTAVCAR